MSRLDPTGDSLQTKISATPIGRLGELEEIANLASYICSDYASWFNGENFIMDGGLTLQASGMFSGYLKVRGYVLVFIISELEVKMCAFSYFLFS